MRNYDVRKTFRIRLVNVVITAMFENNALTDILHTNN